MHIIYKVYWRCSKILLLGVCFKCLETANQEDGVDQFFKVLYIPKYEVRFPPKKLFK